MHFTLTIPHRLGKLKAESRLVSYAMSSPGMDSHLKIIADDWTEATGVLNAHLTADGLSVKIRAIVSDTELEIETDDVPWYAVPYVTYWKSAWRKRLAEILK